MTGQKSVFLKYLNLNSKFSILDNFPNDGSKIIPDSLEKNQSKSPRQKKLAGVGGPYVPSPNAFCLEIFDWFCFEAVVVLAGFLTLVVIYSEKILGP